MLAGVNPQLNCSTNSSVSLNESRKQFHEWDSFAWCVELSFQVVHKSRLENPHAWQSPDVFSVFSSRWARGGDSSPWPHCSQTTGIDNALPHGTIFKMSKCPYAKSLEPICFNPCVAESCFNSWRQTFTSVWNSIRWTLRSMYKIIKICCKGRFW